MAKTTSIHWQQVFPQLSEIDDAVINSIFNKAGIINMPAKATAFRQGDTCSNYLLIVSGRIKVLTRAENGREIVLYRLSDGDSCVLTTSCLFGSARYPAEGITETDVVALAIPATEFHEAIQQSKSFREFVFGSFSSHLGSLIALVEEVAFGKLDIRLARHLIELGGDNDSIDTTHQQLATELGSAREVISRQLKDFESKGWLKLHRGSIEIIEKQALIDLAS
ncbi:MAG: Crp/Fnr family transcriptional regulator [Gammaproteobacteria bacterium]|nr:Crp/Fnr family transcriptional regulator [Gammaproteobacteria bacterium]NNJ96131.1 Crp/Fnr family transcriptional regulator [Gammaproteobacteria bacterium]